jgi:hypothetical protein
MSLHESSAVADRVLLLGMDPCAIISPPRTPELGTGRQLRASCTAEKAARAQSIQAYACAD